MMLLGTIIAWIGETIQLFGWSLMTLREKERWIAHIERLRDKAMQKEAQAMQKEAHDNS